MENYQSIVQGIKETKLPLLIITGISILLQVAVLVASIYLHRPGKDKYSPLEACYFGAKSLFIKNAPKQGLFGESVLKDIKGKSFKIDKITLVKSLGSHACDIVTKDDRGHRGYRFELEKNSKFRHFYRIANIKGQKLVSPYQWEDKR